MNPRGMLPLLLLLSFSLFTGACVPQTDIEREAGNIANDEERDITPIPEEDLPDVEELVVRVLSMETVRGGGRVSVEIALGGETGDDIRLADTARVEWSDGEITDALPHPGANIIIEAGRSDPDEVLEPVRVYLSNVTRSIGTDSEAEVTAEEIVTQWGTFPVLGIEEAQRPPGWRLEFQAAGQRWISEVRVREDGLVRTGEGEDLTFDEDFTPLSAVLRFGTAIEDLEGALPLPAEAELRYAIPEVEVEL
jgi:hypothetical protein